MVTLGALTFLYPWVLSALLALPLIWWLLRITPPQPRRVPFPAFKLLLGLQKQEETAAHTPWWLLLLRVLTIAMLIIGFAGPLLNWGHPSENRNPLVVIVDDGWAAASSWERRKGAAREILVQAETTGRPVLLLTTAEQKSTQNTVSVQTAEQALEMLHVLEPAPWWPDRMAVLGLIDSAALENPEIIWVSDNIGVAGDDEFAAGLKKIGDVRVLVTEQDPLMLERSPVQDASMKMVVKRPKSTSDRSGDLVVAAADGTVIGSFPFQFASGERETEVLIDLPLKLRNAVGRISVRGERSAGATFLLDDSQKRRSVGIATAGDQEDEQPLLSDTYYVRRAIDPYAEVVAGNTGNLVQKEISVLILSDIGQIVGDDLEAVENWVEKGGVLIRFAGPRLAAKRDRLIPVSLRDGGRAFGGALSWESPQKLKPFEPSSPFFGVEISKDVSVKRQVLAEPSIELAGRTWAQLEDGTPLVTAAKRGDGWIVLIHVTANSSWSNLPLSGMFVDMLRKMINISAALPSTSGLETLDASVVLPPVRVLSGFGVAQDPSSNVLPLPHGETKTSPDHPPGIYARGATQRALNIGDQSATLLPVGSSAGVTTETISPPEVVRLRPWLLLGGLLLFLIDWVAVMWLFGRHRVRRFAPTSAAVVLAPMLVVLISWLEVPVRAAEALSDKDRAALAATLETRLAFVITGDRDVDQMSEAGLSGLGRVLASRTAVEPGAPIGVDLEQDELAFFPLLFWPVTESQPALSPEALSRVDAYMKNGGTILFDTRDQQKNILPQLESTTGAGQKKLASLIGSLDIPPLMPLNEEHVLTKSFYLLNTFPGRWAGGRVWVEAQNESTGSTPSSNDGVSSIIIGSNDWAAAWARDDNGRPIAAVVPGGARQRELAMRFGVNLVMYSLTGNYKADSVHIPALLERLGQ